MSGWLIWFEGWVRRKQGILSKALLQCVFFFSLLDCAVDAVHGVRVDDGKPGATLHPVLPPHPRVSPPNSLYPSCFANFQQ